MALAYQTALTIESVIKDIDSKKYLLPSIQREFVWSTGQIEKLFDSLMRDYPINAFLFWKVPREKVSEFKFYELVVLSVLYPWADLKNVFHIDHIYPKSQFTERRLKKKGVASDAMEFYMNNVNYLGNLQLLDGTQNKEKNDSDFDVWLADNYKDSSKLKDYKEKNYIPDVSLAFTNFEEFFTEREKLLVNRLKKELM